MASLSSGLKIGGSTSSLIKSAGSLQTQINTYNDSIQAFQYANSAYTDDAFSAYQSYLQSRIDNLNASPTLTNAQKALTLTKTLESAGKSNISASIQRENIQMMSGNATLSDKYNLIVNQYARAANNGDMTLAQQLMSQAYSVSQSIQYQAQQADAARTTLQQAGVTAQGEVVTSLDNGLKELNGAAKNMSEADFNKYAQQWVQQNSASLAGLGVALPKNAQPNYFDIVQGVTGAKYNALVLKAQAEAPINPQTAQNYAQDAQFLNNGVTKISTLGGDLTLQELQQAASDPAMFAYDNSTGTYTRTQQTGYQYIGGQVAPTYSGTVSAKANNQFNYLTAQETATLKKNGFDITATLNKDGTVGDGITVQATDATPSWLQNVFGKNGEAQFFNQNGNLTFKSGNSFYTLAQDEKGLAGIFQHQVDGSVSLAGGDYGFSASAVQMLINHGQQVTQQITSAENAAAAELKLSQPLPLPNLSVAPPQAPPALSVVKAAPTLKPVTVNPQQTAPSPQQTAPSNGVQGGTFNPQSGSFNPQQGLSVGNASSSGTLRVL